MTSRSLAGLSGQPRGLSPTSGKEQARRRQSRQTSQCSCRTWCWSRSASPSRCPRSRAQPCPPPAARRTPSTPPPSWRPRSPFTCDSKFLRARIDTRAGTVFTQLTNISSGFTKLLEKCFCVFAKIIRIPSGFEELLEMLLFISPKNQIFFQNSPSYRIYAWSINIVKNKKLITQFVCKSRDESFELS